MSLWRIVLRSIRERALSSALTAVSIALGVAVTIAILILQRQARENFNQTAFGYELIVGAKGSPLQLVLNTVFHLDQSPGNVPFSLYQELSSNRRVRLAVPVAVGDAYEAHRIVGTSSAFLTDFEYAPGQKFAFAQGGPFAHDAAALERLMKGEHVHTRFEAVLGSAAAHRTRMRPGSTFRAEHGVREIIDGHVHDEPWTVTGVLEPTGTPNDRAIFINIESFFAIKGHDAKAQISAIILTLESPLQTPMLMGSINSRPDAQAVVPAQVVGQLFDWFAQAQTLLLAVSVLVVVVAGVSILVSIYNSMSERRRSIAIMRALGARRLTVLSIIELEAMMLCLIGGVAGIAAGHALTAVAGRFIESTAGVRVTAWTFHPMELAVLAGLAVLGGIVGILPALKAYRADIAEGLTPSA